PKAMQYPETQIQPWLRRLVRRRGRNGRGGAGSVAAAHRAEFAADNPLADTVDECQRRILVRYAQELLAGRGESGLGKNLGLDSRGQAVGPCLELAFQGGQPFFFANDLVNVRRSAIFHAMLSCQRRCGRRKSLSDAKLSQ